MTQNLPRLQSGSIYGVRWHGRGGQGAVTSAQILAEAAYIDGYKGVTASPFFGAERRGVPVTASTRISAETIRVYSQLEEPDVLIVLDASLIDNSEIVNDLKPGAWLIINSNRLPSNVKADCSIKVALCDVTAIAQKFNLVVAGSTVVGTPILGALVRATSLVSLNSVRDAISKRFSQPASEVNFRAAKTVFDKTVLG